MRRRLPQHVELAGVLHVVQLVADAVLVQPLRAQLQLGRRSAAGVGFVELVDVHRGHTIAELGYANAPTSRRWEPSGEHRVPTVGPMPDSARSSSSVSPSAPSDASGPDRSPDTVPARLIDHMTAEWHSIGRSPGAVRALPGSPGVTRPRRLVLGENGAPPVCPTPSTWSSTCAGPPGSASARRRPLDPGAAARSGIRPFIGRLLIQALVPGLSRGVDAPLGPGRRLAGRRGVLRRAPDDGVVRRAEWAGQDRRYAVLDLLSAIRCRLRRQLLRSKELASAVPLDRARRRRPHLVHRDAARRAGARPDTTCTRTKWRTRRCNSSTRTRPRLQHRRTRGPIGRERRSLYTPRDRASVDFAPTSPDAGGMTRAYGGPVAQGRAARKLDARPTDPRPTQLVGHPRRLLGTHCAAGATSGQCTGGPLHAPDDGEHWGIASGTAQRYHPDHATFRIRPPRRNRRHRRRRRHPRQWRRSSTDRGRPHDPGGARTHPWRPRRGVHDHHDRMAPTTTTTVASPHPCRHPDPGLLRSSPRRVLRRHAAPAPWRCR